MAEIRTIGANEDAGTVNFTGQKIAKITYKKPFEQKPGVTITLEDAGSNHTPHKTKVKTTGFRVVFKNPYNGLVAWKAEKI